MKKALLVAFAVSLTAVAPVAAQAGGSGGITMSQALAIAQQNTAGLTLLFSRTEPTSTQMVYGFYFMRQDGHIIEKEIGGKGQVILVRGTEEIKGSDAPNRGRVNPQVVQALQTRVQTKLPANQYFEIAQGRHNGSANNYVLTLQGDQLVVQVSGTNDNGDAWRCNIDMATGRIVE